MKNFFKQSLIIFFSLISCFSTAVGQVFEEHRIDGSLGFIEDIIAFDLDRDGDMDVLASIRTNNEREQIFTLMKYENTGGGEFERRTIVDNFTWMQGITPMDFDNDGDIDILLAGCEEIDEQVSYTILENTGNLDFEIHSINANFDQHAAPSEIQAADLDGDDDLDIAVAYSLMDFGGWYWGGLKMYLQTELYTFRDTTLVDYGANGWRSLSLEDLDNDDDVDIISNEYGFNNNEHLRFGCWENEDGSFEYHPLGFIDLANIIVFDLNQDGRLDLIRCGCADEDWTNIYWLENHGDFDFERRNIHGNRQEFINNAAISDYDLDGDLDIITSGYGLVYIGRLKLNIPYHCKVIT